MSIEYDEEFVQELTEDSKNLFAVLSTLENSKSKIDELTKFSFSESVDSSIGEDIRCVLKNYCTMQKNMKEAIKHLKKYEQLVFNLMEDNNQLKLKMITMEHIEKMRKENSQQAESNREIIKRMEDDAIRGEVDVHQAFLNLKNTDYAYTSTNGVSNILETSKDKTRLLNDDEDDEDKDETKTKECETEDKTETNQEVESSNSIKSPDSDEMDSTQIQFLPPHTSTPIEATKKPEKVVKKSKVEKKPKVVKKEAIPFSKKETDEAWRYFYHETSDGMGGFKDSMKPKGLLFWQKSYILTTERPAEAWRLHFVRTMCHRIDEAPFPHVIISKLKKYLEKKDKKEKKEKKET